ncbi:unnamed protein product [Colias eurytheme]|nr:unnamed protein product [Colias eurytheme]
MDFDGFDIVDLDISQENLHRIDLLEASIFREIEKRCSEEKCEEESEDEIIRPPKRRARVVINSDSEIDKDSVEDMVRSQIDKLRDISIQRWGEARGHQPSVIAFTEPTGMKEPFASQLRNSPPGEYFSLVVPDKIFESIAIQTNLFAEQAGQSSKPSSRSHSWKPTTINEIKQVFGLILYMGLVKLPKIADYWSTNQIFGQKFPGTVMSRNRFELILKNLHYVNNETADKSDRIYKIRPLIEELNETFQKSYAPKEDVCVDESQVPFRGRIIFRQYNKSKRHKYGMKLFKLCTLPGYTCKLQLYAGKNHELLNTSPTNVVMGLCDGLLNLGHTVSTDNWYTNLELANQLLDNDTHLVGTLRKNRRGLPKQVIEAKLKPGLLNDQLIGPIILPDNLNGERFLEFLQNDFLEVVPLVFRQRHYRRPFYFQMDGAPAHFSRNVRAHVDARFVPWVGRGGTIAWPPRSPDLTPLDFFLWGTMKQKVYQQVPNTREEVLQKIMAEAEEIRNQSDIVMRATQLVGLRVMARLQNNGGHFEQLF